MKSALTFRPEKWKKTFEAMKLFKQWLFECQRLTNETGRIVKVVLQHSLKNDKFAIQVTADPRAGHHGTAYYFTAAEDSVEKALKKTLVQMFNVRRDLERRRNQWSLSYENSKPKARREGRKGPRRAGSKGQRSNRLRQERRSNSRRRSG